MKSHQSVGPNRAEEIKDFLRKGGRVYIGGSAYQAAILDRKVIRRFDKAGAWFLKAEGNGYRMQRGRGTVYLVPGQLRILDGPGVDTDGKQATKVNPMTDIQLRKAVLRLAHEKPELREHLLPLVKQAAPTSWRYTLGLIEDYVRNPTEQGQAELSDYAVNILREEGKSFGYDSRDLLTMARQELPRFRGLRPNKAGLTAYLRMSRAGSEYRLNRRMRAALFAQMVAKGIIQ